jgi:predicted RNA-binding protein with PUA domain
MELGKDAHQMRLDLLVNGYVIKFYHEINNNTTVLVAASNLTQLGVSYLNMFNGIVWF